MKRGIGHITPAFWRAAFLISLVNTTLPGQPVRPEQPVRGGFATAPQGVSVLTQHNDNGRTGANLFETQLTTASVSSGGFGMLFSLPVDGQIYAQPLYVSNLRFPNGSVHNVVYVATMHNTVYAFDADKPAGPLWTRPFGNSVGYEFMKMSPAKGSFRLFVQNGCKTPPANLNVPHNIEPEIGITSTPVIDFSSNTIYVVAKSKESDASFAYRLHALDLLTGAERGDSGAITVTVPGTGKNSVSSPSGTVTFDARMQLQRPGLLLANGRVYLAFGAHQDTDYYHGWVLAYDAKTLKLTNAFATTPNGEDGGIWQSGNGLASDPAGNIYLMVGNGTSNRYSGGMDLGDSFIKLSPDLRVLDWFTPEDHGDMENNDLDLGSAGPMLFPGLSLLVGGGKKGKFYLLDTGSMGHLEDGHSPGDHHAAQAFQAAAGSGGFAQPCGIDNHNIHGSPVLWNSPRDGPLVYIWAERDNLRAFKFDSARRQFASTDPVYKSTMKDPDSGDPYYKPMPGAALSISANGSTAGTGILWASLPLYDDAVAQLTSGILRAFDAADVGHDLWCGGVGTFPKFTPPTIANGKVYLPTFGDTRGMGNRLNVYGNGAHGPFAQGLNKTYSTPFVSDGYIYFRGPDDRLLKVRIDGTGASNPGLNKTYSAPFVSEGYIYFRGPDDRLLRVHTDGHGESNPGGNKTKSAPFVSEGYMYFQGTDDRLLRVRTDGHGESNPGGNKTSSTPFVADGYIYFQGTDNRLLRVRTDGTGGQFLGYATKSSPFVFKGYVYFQGTDDKLWKVNVNNPAVDRTNFPEHPYGQTGPIQKDALITKSSPVVATSRIDGRDYVYFQGADNRLWRISTDGTSLASPNCNSTNGTPFVYGDSVFFQGTDNRLLRAGAND